MRTIIYFGVVGFFLVSAFLNLDGNDWQPVELPKVVTSLFESGEKILPSEEWEEILIGKWEFLTSSSSSKKYEGTVIFNDDKSFVRKVSYSIGTNPKRTAGGTIRGTWEVKGDMWIEKVSECNIIPEYLSVCEAFEPLTIYGEKESDYFDYSISYFNQDRVVIVRRDLSDNDKVIFKFDRMEN